MKKREALEIMLMMWDYISLHYGYNKAQAIYDFSLPEMENDCPCCEYNNMSCDNCIIDWPQVPISEVTYHAAYAPCETSFYGVWEKHGTRHNAAKIANLALETLNRLYPEEL